jgi:hypothetical protein
MPRPKGVKNQRTLLREALARHDVKVVEAMAVVEQAMTRFFLRATDPKRKPKLTAKEKFQDTAYLQAAFFAAQLLPFRHPRMATMKLTSDPNKPRDDQTAEELRAEILEDMRRLGLFEDMKKLPPAGVANRERRVAR